MTKQIAIHANYTTMVLTLTTEQDRIIAEQKTGTYSTRRVIIPDNCEIGITSETDPIEALAELTEHMVVFGNTTFKEWKDDYGDEYETEDKCADRWSSLVQQKKALQELYGESIRMSDANAQIYIARLNQDAARGEQI